MKTLTLLRHAKSTWDDPVARDFDRPLNPRGRRAARAVGREMKGLGLGFDRVVASPARRVIETLDEVAASYGALARAYEQRVYLATTDSLLDIVHETGDAVARLLLVGHNPGMENLALLLTSGGGRNGGLRGEVEVKYPTGTLAEIALPVDRWQDVREGAGTLTRFIRPRDLAADLGPDEDTD
jgi:phosphohistidine phosphatase